MRYFLELAYQGTHYSGWQIQNNAISVQQKIQEVLSIILKEPIEITGSGRTDAGVHAKQQYAHFDSDVVLNEQHLYKINSLLPYDVSIDAIHLVGADSHARFDATRRSYEYFLHQKKSPFVKDLSYFFHHPLDIKIMNQAAQLMITPDKRNFACFTKAGHSSLTYDCQIFQAGWHVVEKDRLVFRISANRFLRGMVRAIVGTLLDIGTHKITLEKFAQILAMEDRSKAGRSVDAQGLYLSEVCYPETVFKEAQPII